MKNIETFFILLGTTQILHSIEEIFTGFAQKWPLWKMSQKTFVLFEIALDLLILFFIFSKQAPLRIEFMIGFNLLMFANGIWHLMWAGISKKYIPGLLTAPLFVIIFIFYYFSLI